MRRGGRPSRVVREAVDTGVAELVPDRDRPDGWTLLLDGSPQSHVDLAEPTYLEYEYLRRIGHVVDLAGAPGQPLRVLHLGGGALTLPRYVAATRPGSWQQVVEVDGRLAELIRRELPWPRTMRVRVRVTDAREALSHYPDGRFDLVVGDVFAGALVPAHLTSVECAEQVSRVLVGGGRYALNIADGPPLTFARAQAATIRTVFPHACLLADAPVLRGRRFGNLVLVASHRPLPVAELTRLAAGDPFPARLVHGADLAAFTGGARPVADATASPSSTPPPRTFPVGLRTC